VVEARVPFAPTTHADPAATTTHRHVHHNRCARNEATRIVLVSVEAQHAWLCAQHRTVLSTAVTTGATQKGNATPLGNFRIEGRNRNTVLYPNSGGAYPVKYWIPFDAPLYGFHDASWQKMPFGSPHYVTRGSHGCVHMPLGVMRFLYHWARIGTRVVIR
jgi:lipoprotein-anchoring transpeptidase ErfK/SrfK